MYYFQLLLYIFNSLSLSLSQVALTIIDEEHLIASLSLITLKEIWISPTSAYLYKDVEDEIHSVIVGKEGEIFTLTSAGEVSHSTIVVQDFAAHMEIVLIPTLCRNTEITEEHVPAEVSAKKSKGIFGFVKKEKKLDLNVVFGMDITKLIAQTNRDELMDGRR